MYPNMQTKTIKVNEEDILTCGEGYIVNLDDWSEDFTLALAREEGLELTNEHWEVVQFIRDFHHTYGVQASVREMIKHFRSVWGKEKGSNPYLHKIFPKGGPQKQGNRLAGIRRTKGEH